jgi:hypothetical protein
MIGALRHVAYAGGWKKLEPMWDFVIRSKRVARLRPMLEAVLTGFGRYGVSPEYTRERAPLRNYAAPTAASRAAVSIRAATTSGFDT